MTAGPGRYDDLATYCREMSDASGVVVLVIGGTAGNGFSVQGELHTLAGLPAMLEDLAREIRKDLAEGGWVGRTQ